MKDYFFEVFMGLFNYILVALILAGFNWIFQTGNSFNFILVQAGIVLAVVNSGRIANIDRTLNG
jgi:hypothetical protein